MSIFSKLFAKGPVPLYRLFKPRSSEILGPWTPHFPVYTQVVGHSSLGHIFLHDPSGQDYAVLHPFKRSAKSYGRHGSIVDFEKNVLHEPGFESFVLRPAHVQVIASRLGALKHDEIYIPAPYPFLGGSDKPETYDKGDMWVFAHIVAEMLGLEP